MIVWMLAVKTCKSTLAGAGRSSEAAGAAGTAGSLVSGESARHRGITRAGLPPCILHAGTSQSWGKFSSKSVRARQIADGLILQAGCRCAARVARESAREFASKPVWLCTCLKCVLIRACALCHAWRASLAIGWVAVPCPAATCNAAALSTARVTWLGLALVWRSQRSMAELSQSPADSSAVSSPQKEASRPQHCRRAGGIHGVSERGAAAHPIRYHRPLK